MADTTEYSDIQAKAMKSAHSNDNEFHTTFYISDVPFAEMLQTNADGLSFTAASATASIVVPSGIFRVDLRMSEEQECWFFTATFGTDEFSGVVHFNTVYNPKGRYAFMFLNDTDLDDYKSITRLLPYSNFFIMVK